MNIFNNECSIVLYVSVLKDSKWCKIIIKKQMDTHNLTESEKQIKKFILDQNNDISAMTSIELGKRSYTSQASVMRFYKNLGLGHIVNLYLL